MNQQIAQIARTFLLNLDRHIQNRASSRISDFLGDTEKPKRTHEPIYCPVPNCKNAAHLCRQGKIWYMACTTHSKVGAKKIAQYRKARVLSKHLDIPVFLVLKNWDKYRKRYDRKFGN